MDEQLKMIKKYRNLSDSTLSLYSRNMNLIAKCITGGEFKDIEFIMTHYDLVMEYLDTLSDSTRRTYICAILAYISKEKGVYYTDYEYIGEDLNDMLLELQIEFDEAAVSQEKSQKQIDNWVTMEDLHQIRTNMWDELLQLNIYDYNGRQGRRPCRRRRKSNKKANTSYR